ncbi:MAG: glycosyltransferase family 9 protein [Pseudomonadota bacterium]
MAILFITSTYIGDAILSSGVLKRLLDDYSDDPVTIACGAPAAKVFEAVPRLARIHVIRKRRRSLHWFDLWRATAGQRWRVVVDLRRTAMPYVLRAGDRRALPKNTAPIHRVELNAMALGSAPLDPIVWTNATHEERARDLVGEGRDIIAMAPGASWPGKIWPAQSFVDLANRLLAPSGALAGSRLLLVGAEQERETAQPIFDGVPDDWLIDGMGVDVLSTYAAMRRCRLFVGNDSAMMHLAAATGRPTVGLFGPTNDVHYGPWGPNGLVVRTPESIQDLIGGPDYDTRTTGTMMGGLTADMVEAAIRNRWGDSLEPILF